MYFVAAITISEYLTKDHERLDGLLSELIESERSHSGSTATSPIYLELKQGMLQHIRLEETRLFPAARSANGGNPLPMAAKLRLDHGAIAALLVLPPDSKVLQALRTILDAHNRLEEAYDGMYAICDAMLDSTEKEHLLTSFENLSPVPIAKNTDVALARRAAGNSLERAGFSRSLLDW